jgi:hypothetical protein
MPCTIEQRTPPGTVLAVGSADGIVGDTVALIHEGKQIAVARIIATAIRHDGRVLALTLDVDEELGRHFNSEQYLNERGCLPEGYPYSDPL